MLFRSASARERCAALAVQRASIFEEAYKIAYQATYQNHDGHWDHTMRGGAGCKECIKAREARNKCDALINDYRKTLDLSKGNKI